ncbi:MAG: hypothetical protein A2355_04895 [Spirochaetes bacterium RIFOXYB1_FULL_32_8]|nr:MAG: hypothetical protein A2355_04895 [Spirochaetes bacterium RIFOXYB1_FULL_32_8]
MNKSMLIYSWYNKHNLTKEDLTEMWQDNTRNIETVLFSELMKNNDSGFKGISLDFPKETSKVKNSIKTMEKFDFLLDPYILNTENMVSLLNPKNQKYANNLFFLTYNNSLFLENRAELDIIKSRKYGIIGPIINTQNKLSDQEIYFSFKTNNSPQLQVVTLDTPIHLLSNSDYSRIKSLIDKYD